MSAESGSDHPSRTPPVFKNTALDGTFDCNGIQRLTCANLSKVNTVLSGIQPDMRDLVLVLLNDPEYRDLVEPSPWPPHILTSSR